METLMQFQIGATGVNANEWIQPTICTFKNQFHCFYGELGSGRIKHVRSSDGIHWDVAHQTNVGDSRGRPSCSIVFWGQMHVFYRHGRGEILHIRTTDGETWDTPYNIGWATEDRSGVSVASLDDSFVLVYRNYQGDGIMYSKFTGGWKHGNTGHTSRAPRPGIVAYGGRYHLFYKDGGDNGHNRGIMHAFSNDGETWMGATPFHVSNTETSASPIAVGYGAKLHLFYRDARGNAIFHAASVNGFEFEPAAPFNIGLDLYDGPSTAVLDNTLCLIGVEANGSKVMRAVHKP